MNKTSHIGNIVTPKKLAEIIGKTEQRVNQLAKDGILKKITSGKWDLVQNMKMCIAFLENKINRYFQFDHAGVRQ